MKGWVVQKMELKGNSIELSVFKIWHNWSEKNSIIDNRLGSKYVSEHKFALNISWKNIVYRKLMKFFKVLFSQREIKS